MELPPRNCPSCGASNLATAIYCRSCKSILPAIPVMPGVMGRVKDRSFIALLIDRIRALPGAVVRETVSVILLLCGLVLAFWPREVAEFPPEDPGMMSSLGGMLEAHLPAGTRTVSDAAATQLLRNCIGRQGMIKGGAVTFAPGGIETRLLLRWHVVTLTVRITYRLEGGPGSWNLVPESGSIGHLPLGGAAVSALLSVLPGWKEGVVPLVHRFCATGPLELTGHALRF